MATLINRKMFWAVNGKALPCVVVAHDLDTSRVSVVLANGARHDVSAYDVRATQGEALQRVNEQAVAQALDTYMMTSYPNLI